MLAAIVVVLNEIDSSPADGVESINPGETPLDLTGYEIRDNLLSTFTKP